MRTLFLCLLSLLMTSATLAGEGRGLVPVQLSAHDILGLIAFGALGGMLVWHLRR